MTLPSWRVSALLVLMSLGFGVIVGRVSSSPPGYALAASARPRLKLILPPPPAAAPATAVGTAAAVSPPAAAAEATPSPTSEEPSSAESSGGKSPSTAGKSTGKSGTAPSPSSSKSGDGGGGKGGGGKGGKGEEGGASTAPSSDTSSKLPSIKHVFVIVLSDQPYASVFGPSSTAPYLAHTLERKGELLVRYYAVAHEQLANGIALLSGQGPTVETAGNCSVYTDISPSTVGAAEQVVGHGCVYPSSTATLAGQLAAKRLTWRAYVQGMDEGTASGAAAGACGHPSLGAPDPTSAPTPPGGQPYATFRNPFVYFHSVIDSSACAGDDVGLSGLKGDLASASRTPSFSYIVPDRCNDGEPTPCAAGAPAGLGAAEGFLKQVVPEILGSQAYRDNGLLAITVDEAPSSGELADSSSCCGQPQFPNLPPSTTGVAPDGGGQVGALLLSPFIKQGVSQEPYNHFSLLRTIEDLFGLKHLGYAAAAHVSSFEPSIFTK